MSELSSKAERDSRGNGVPRTRAVYTVGVTALLVFFVNLQVRKLEIDPMKAAQDSKLMFLGPRSPSDPVYSPVPPNTRDHVSILFTGNSQTYSIMDYSPGESNMITLLSDMLNNGQETASAEFPVRYGAEGNLRMSELLIKSADAVVASDHRPDVLICGVVLDGLRWADARAEIAQRSRLPAIHSDLDAVIKERPDLTLAARVVESMRASPDVQANATPHALETGVQPKEVFQNATHDSTVSWSPSAVEDRLEAALDRHVPLFAKRRMMYTYFIDHYLAARNALLHLDTSTRRAMPQGMYQANLQLIELSLEYLRRHGVHAVFYLAPIRPIEPNPYEPRDVERFRVDFLQICARQQATCFDYSNLVPESMWTNYPQYIPGQSGQRDYAHFTGRGHQRVATQLAQDLRPLLTAWRAQKSAAR
jgi:hypothetical protein